MHRVSGPGGTDGGTVRGRHEKYVLGPNAARKLKRLLRGSGEVSRRDNLASGLAFGSEYADPFAVQWAQSAANGSGSWLIWLPVSESLVMVGDRSADPSDGLEEEPEYPTGWFRIEDLAATGGNVYLNITNDEDEIEAKIETSADTGADWSILVANATRDQSSGKVVVKQLVKSAVVLGGSESARPSPFRLETTTSEDPDTGDPVKTVSVVDCAFYFDGELNEPSDYPIPAATLASGTVYLTGSNSGTGGWSFSVSNEPTEAEDDEDVINIKLYDFEDGEVVMDYRTTFLTSGQAPVSSISGEVDEYGDEPGEKVKGDVVISGKDGSGLKFSSSSAGGVGLDIDGRAASDEFAVRSVKSAAGLEIAKVFGTADFSVGGGGGTSGYSGTLDVPTGELRCNYESEYKIQSAYRRWTFENGLLKSVSSKDIWTDGLPTTPHSGEI